MAANPSDSGRARNGRTSSQVSAFDAARRQSANRRRSGGAYTAAAIPSLRGLPRSADDVLAVVENMSRKIDDLARELNCLGYFDDPDDRPRAA